MEQIDKVLPKYGENIVVGVMFKRHFEWYVAPKNLWKMDYKKLYSVWKFAYEKSGRSLQQLEADIGSYEEFCKKRWNIEIIDGFTASHFLPHLFNCRYSADELRLLRMVAHDDRKKDYDASLFINFDTNTMYSQFPKPESFENFVPVGWHSEYRNFMLLVPSEKRY